MSRFASIRLLKGEIKKVNRLIDYKIIHGLTYGREARYHKSLVHRLDSLQQRGVLFRSFVAMF